MTLYPLTASQTLANLRTDLADANPATYRWADVDLNRAIDRAVERYSWASPRMQAVQQPAAAAQILYASPPGAYYIDGVEYPLGGWPKRFVTVLPRRSPLIAAPAAAPTVAPGNGGALFAGVYRWAVSFTVPGNGETTPSPLVALTSAAGGAASLGNLPTGQYGVSGRNIYRTAAGGSTLLLVAAVADNTTTTYLDETPDSALGIPAPASNTTAEIDQFELQLPPDLWPRDGSTSLEIRYATKHELDANGTTIPERHWEALYLGAVMYAMLAYLPTVNDNFEYADGHLRDRVDDTKSTIAWHTSCDRVRQEFAAMLQLIKEEGNAAVTGRAQWGDVPLRWERL